jgi:hypothetical protein
MEEGADNDVVALDLLALVVDDLDRAGLVEDDVPALGGLHQAQRLVLDRAGGLDADLGGLEAAGGDAADVEGAHRQLGAGLADRLRGDDADGVADLGDAVGGRVDAVRLGVDAVLGRRCERRHDLHALDADVLDLGRDLLGDELAGAHDVSEGLSGFLTLSLEQRPMMRSFRPTISSSPSMIAFFHTPSRAPQSSSAMMTSIATSQSLRVR